MKETIKEFISEERLMQRISELADQINHDYAGKSVHLICILRILCLE